MKITHKILSTLLACVFTTSLSAEEILAHSKGFTPELVTTLVQPYLAIQQSLAGDNLDEAKQGAEAFGRVMAEAPQSGDSKKEADTLIGPVNAIAKSSDIAAGRIAFQTLSQEFATLLRHMGTTKAEPLYLIHCPMAFDNKGADWVQADKTVANPYFGASMLRCGSVKAELSPQGTNTGKSENDHEAHH